MPIRTLAAGLGLAVSLATPALADLTLTYDVTDFGPMTMYLSDHGLVVDMGGNGSTVFYPASASETGKPAAYVVQGSGANVMVIDALALLNNPKLAAVGAQAAEATEGVTIEKTDRTETIAGVTGTLYLVTSKEGDTQEFVMSKDLPDEQLYGSTMKQFTAAFDGAMGGNVFEDVPPEVFSSGVTLRADDQFVLKSWSGADIDPARFRLPAKPMDLMDPMKKVLGLD